MDPQLITLILNIVLGAFILLGFLFGLKGIKKSTFNFVVFLIKTITVFILTPVFSKIVLGISISGKTVELHIYDAIIKTIGQDMASSAFMSSLIDALPIMFVNIAVFIALYIVLALVFKLIAVIVYKIMFRKDKEQVVEKVEIVNGTPQMVKNTVKKKKHRLWGGLVGAVHGFLFILVLLFPAIGLANIFNDVAGISKVQAETQTTQIQYFDELLRDKLPKEVVSYAKALDDSILFKIGKAGSVAETSFNMVAKTSINGSSVSLGNEIRSFVGAYDSLVAFTRSSSSITTDYSINSIYENLMNNPEEYDFDTLYSAIDKLFSSNILNATGKDALKFVADMLVDNAKDEKSLKLMTHIKSAIYAYANGDYSLKDDINAVVSIFETCATSGLLKELNSEDVTFAKIKPILLNEANVEQNKPENEVLNKLTKSVTTSNLFQKILIELTNYGLEELEVEMAKSFKFEGSEPVTLRKIDSSKKYELKESELSKIFVDFITLSEEIELINEDAVKQDFFNIFDSNVETIIEKIGTVLNDFVSLSILKDTGVFASICDEMARTEYNNYISFETLKRANVVSSQFDYLADSIKVVKDSEIINEIRYIKNIDDGADRIKNIISKLAHKTDGTTTIAQKIVEPLLKCDIFKNAIVYGLNEANKYVETELIKINPNASLNTFNTEDLLTEEENVKLVNLINNLVQFADGVTLSKLLTPEFVDELLMSDNNIANLGNAMDAIQQSSLFADHGGKDGVYKNIMTALSGFESFNDFFDFEVAKNNEFSWLQTSQDLIELKNNLDTVTINDGDNNVKLLKYILTFGDYNVLIDELYGKDVNLTKLFEIDILKPTAVKVINLINSNLKELVDKNIENEDEKLGTNIKSIDKTVNIKDQASSINKLINIFLKIDFENSDQETAMGNLNLLLNAFEENAQNNGVFTEAYKAFLLRYTNVINNTIKYFAGEDGLGGLIQFINTHNNIETFKDDIYDIINAFIDFNLSDNIKLNEINDENSKTNLNSLLNKFALAASKENSPFAISYNLTLIKLVNVINASIKDIVQTAGSEIIEITQAISVVEDNDKIIDLLNSVIDIVNNEQINNINITNVNVDELFAVVDLFKANEELANNAFVETSNAILVHITNVVNSAIGTEVDVNLQVLDGKVTPDYNKTKNILTTGKAVFNLMETNETDLVGISTTEEFEAFILALQENDYTKEAKIAIENYIAKQAI